MPDLDQLAGFDPGSPPPMLPPAEIRRRGDRRRRTSALVVAGAALAAVVAVGVPAALLSGGGGGRDVQPAPSPPPGTTDWVTTVSADFPLTAGFPAPAEIPARRDAQLTPTCGSWFSGSFADESVVTYTGESEDRAQRWLILFDDDRAAEASLAQARASIAQCPADGISGGPGSGVRQVYSTVPVDLGTEESFAWTQQVRHDDGLLSELTYVQIGRTGNALYVESAFGAAGGDQVVAEQSARLQERSAAPLQSMCLFAANPCVIESEAATDRAPAPPATPRR